MGYVLGAWGGNTKVGMQTGIALMYLLGLAGSLGRIRATGLIETVKAVDSSRCAGRANPNFFAEQITGETPQGAYPSLWAGTREGILRSDGFNSLHHRPDSVYFFGKYGANARSGSEFH